MEQNEQLPEGEFHHFQLVGQDGEIPLSVSILVHVNPKASRSPLVGENPITSNDVLALHEALQSFDGDFVTAFSKK